MSRFPCYVVIRGRIPGVYTNWHQCATQVLGYSNALYQGCESIKEAEQILRNSMPTNNVGALVVGGAMPPNPPINTHVPFNGESLRNDLCCIKSLVVVLLVLLIALVIKAIIVW
ncbi:hypothetical protein AQUCO_00400778v1 [Aquilegia coerulea]|uniref:Ribonuclease H1 N-terminal domain-containing protein n=1 Tax=Aquilegia coerulea TaxID=218851 RepID=A0A2G5EWK8_AQUCA|nr:hypothetical protein AQUCO_00400778v1 [Aquilegia coerulea]